MVFFAFEADPFWWRAAKENLAVFTAGLAVWLAYQWFRSQIKLKEAAAETTKCLGEGCPYRQANEDQFVTRKDLHAHPLWGFIDYAITTKVEVLPIREPGRRLIAQDFLRIKLEAVREYLSPIVALEDLNDMSVSELNHTIYLALNGAIKAYEERAEKAGIPKIFIHRFKVIHSVNTDYLLEQVDAVCESDWYDYNYQKLAVIFDDVRIVLRRTILDCERTLGTVNGELDGYVYKGVTVQPMHDHRPKPISDYMSRRSNYGQQA